MGSFLNFRIAHSAKVGMLLFTMAVCVLSQRRAVAQGQQDYYRQFVRKYSEGLKSLDPDERRGAAYKLSTLAKADGFRWALQDAVPPLQALIENDVDTDVRIQAADTLVTISTRPEDDVTPLFARILDHDTDHPKLRQFVTVALARIGSAAHHADASLCLVLGKKRTIKETNPLIPELKYDDDLPIKIEAANALGIIGRTDDSGVYRPVLGQEH